MTKTVLSPNFKRALSSLTISCSACLVLSAVVYKGKYFQNWLNSAYASDKRLILIGWFLLFVYYGLCLFRLLQIKEKDTTTLFLFGFQFIAFSVYMIAVYCFSAYALATVGGIFSVIFSCRLVFELLKNRRYVSALLTAAVTALYLYCVFCGIIFCSLEYGVWKN